MNPIRNYILTFSSAFALMLLASCSNDEWLSTEPTDDNQKGVYAIMPELNNVNVSNGLLSRSTLQYDYIAKNTLFNWEEKDVIGVYSYKTTTPVIPFTRKKDQTASTAALVNNIFLAPNDMQPIVSGQQYISYRPFSIGAQEDITYTSMPITYANQQAADFAKMKFYLTESKRQTPNYTEANASEKKASEHLGSFDYLASGETTANPNGGITFDMKRVGVVTRFYMKCPAAEVYDSLQLVAQGPQFTIEGTMNAVEKTITPTKKSNRQTLLFKQNGVNESGVDMTVTTSDYYYNNVGYIVTYMMLAPIDLSGAQSLNIYLFSHDSYGNRKYYRAIDVKKPNLTANMFYQWTSGNNTLAEPIQFEPISVEVWENDVNYQNNGTGTSGW